MNRVPKSALSILTWPLWLAVVTACHADEPASFLPLQLTAGPGPIGATEPILIRFSKPLAREAVPKRSVRVTSLAGHPVSVRLSVDGRLLRVDPDNPLQRWPDLRGLRVQVLHPIASQGLRAQDGSELMGGLSAEVAVDDTMVPRGQDLELVVARPNPEGAPLVTASDHIALTFSAPLDPRTIEVGCQVFDRARDVSVEDVVRFVDPLNPRTIIISPFAGGLPWAADQVYEVRLGLDLRSSEGRLLKSPLTLRWRTAPGNDRLLQVGFRSETDLDPRSVSALSEPFELLKPRPLFETLIPPVPGGSLASLTSGWSRTDPFIPNLFGLTPTRAQVLIPWSWLSASPDSEFAPHRCLIQALTFHLAEPIPADAAIDEVRLRLGYLSRRSREAETGLSDRFEHNDEGGRRSKTLQVAGGLPWRLSPSSRVEERRYIRLEFAEPFLYDRTEGDLVLTIEHSGVYAGPTASLPAVGLGLQGLPDRGTSTDSKPRAGALLLSATPPGRGESARTVHSRFQPYLWISTISYPSVVSRWHVVAGQGRFRFFREPGLGIRARGEEERDFQIYYQGGEPAMTAEGTPLADQDGRPLCLESGPFDLGPPTDGARAVRLRIEFMPRSPHADGDPPEIEYVLLGYQEL